MPLLQLLLNLPALLVGTLVKYIWFYKKGFGKVYKEGLIEGFKTLSKVKKVPYRWKHFLNYLYIEWLLIKNVFKYMGTKVKR